MTEDPRDPTPSEEADPVPHRRAYEAAGITVHFDPHVCIHSGVCVRGLPQVFEVGRRPWVRADLDTPQRIANQIDRCPSGALSYVIPADAS